MLERSRLESEVIKHYTINQGANLTIIPSFVPKNADRPENRYSIPLGELCPEL